VADATTAARPNSTTTIRHLGFIAGPGTNTT
jgi:hypothetical protein